MMRFVIFVLLLMPNIFQTQQRKTAIISQESTRKVEPIVLVTAAVSDSGSTSSSEDGPQNKQQESWNPPAWASLLANSVAAFGAVGALWVVGRQTKAMRLSSQRQLRAYLMVSIGEAIYQQDREAPLKKLLFEARPILFNTGQTPAYKIHFKSRAAILALPLPKNVVLPEAGDADDEHTILGSKQNGFMAAYVDGYVLDEEVETIKHASGSQGLYVWGLVTYEDAFGDKHFTRYCQHIYWNMGGEVRGNYVPGRNDAN